MIFQSKTILIISPESWGTNFVSKHHYATELAERGNKVYFLNPPGSRNDIMEINKNLYLLTYKPLIKGINYLYRWLRDRVSLIDIAKIIKLADRPDFDIVWSFDPYRFQNLNLFKSKIAIYHSVDVHNKVLEREIANSADMVLGSSDQILQDIKTKNPKIKINHGLGSQFSNHVFNYKSPAQRIKVGYVGNLHYQHIDKVVLRRIIEENPEIEFHFIGPSKLSNLSKKCLNEDLIQFIEKQKNCLLHGAKPYNQLPELLNQFHLFLMCYTGDKNVAEMANPHKILEYLSTGKVVVSHYIDEYKDKRNLLEMVEDNTQLSKKIKEVIHNLDYYNRREKQQIRIAWSEENTYLKQIERIERQLTVILRI